MRSEQLEHVLRAAADILREEDFIVIGSAAILASYPDEALPIQATRSAEADVIPWDDPQRTKADQIEGAIGEGSLFHETHGYYAQGVDRDTAKLPTGWELRLVRFGAPGLTNGSGYCLEKHDLAASKLVAGRPKDYEFVESLLSRGMLDADIVLERVRAIPTATVPAIVLSRARKWIESQGAQ